MSPAPRSGSGRTWRAPRACGDEPRGTWDHVDSARCSPRTRGRVRRQQPMGVVRQVLPHGISPRLGRVRAGQGRTRARGTAFFGRAATAPTARWAPVESAGPTSVPRPRPSGAHTWCPKTAGVAWITSPGSLCGRWGLAVKVPGERGILPEDAFAFGQNCVRTRRVRAYWIRAHAVFEQCEGSPGRNAGTNGARDRQDRRLGRGGGSHAQ